jgi:hypothetical protein
MHDMTWIFSGSSLVRNGAWLAKGKRALANTVNTSRKRPDVLNRSCALGPWLHVGVLQASLHVSWKQINLEVGKGCSFSGSSLREFDKLLSHYG